MLVQGEELAWNHLWSGGKQGRDFHVLWAGKGSWVKRCVWARRRICRGGKRGDGLGQMIEGRGVTSRGWAKESKTLKFISGCSSREEEGEEEYGNQV